MKKIKKMIGKMKDEICEKQIEEFVGLRAKLCGFRADDEVKKAKGVKKNVIKKI